MLLASVGLTLSLPGQHAFSDLSMSHSPVKHTAGVRLPRHTEAFIQREIGGKKNWEDLDDLWISYPGFVRLVLNCETLYIYMHIYIYKELNANAVCPYLIFTFLVSGCFANCKGKRTRFRERRSKLNLLLEKGFCKPCFEQHRSKGIRTLSLKATENFQWTKRWRNQEKTLTSAEGSQTFYVLLAHATLALLLKSFFFKLVGLALPRLKKKKTDPRQL